MDTPCTVRKNDVFLSKKRGPDLRLAHLVHDGGLGGFSSVGDGDRLEAIRPRVSATELGDIEGDDLVIK